MMRRWWSAIAAPSLMRRLLLAQLLLLGLVWVIAVAFVAHEASKDVAVLGHDRAYEAFLTVASNEAAQPERLQASLHAMDAAMRENYGSETDPGLVPSIFIERGARTIYRSVMAPPGLQSVAPGAPQVLVVDGKRWRVRTVAAADGELRVTMVMSADRNNIFLTLNSRGYLLLPLLVSLPFLILPAWLSIRLALRPWRQVAGELAARGPQDLRPLSYQAGHREMKGMVDNMNALMRRVSDSAQRERAFIADAAHELRTPLAAMRINVEALQGQASNPAQQQLLDGILSSGARATRLVSQLLRLMRSDAPAEEAEALCLDALVQERMAALAGIADARGIELEMSGDSGLQVTGRREGLVSLVDNLLDNAIKYSPERGVVHADLRRENGQAVLRITDQGPGIAPELRERVFDRFFRDPRQTQGGSGLGLAIARAVALQHGGDISLDAVDPGAAGAGLLVSLRLPLSAPDAAA